MKRIAHFFLIYLLFTAACKESPNTPQQRVHVPPILPDRSIIKYNYPANAPAEVDTSLGECRGDLNFVFILMEFAKDSLPEGQYPEWMWSVETSPYAMIIKAKVLAENIVQWQIVLNSDEVIGENFPNNWLQSTGTITDRDKSGAFDIFEPFNENLLAQTTWSRNDDGTLEMNTQKNQKNYQFISNPDQSGNIVVTGQSIKLFEASWDASGAGSWASFDASTGQQTGNGEWSP